MNQWEKVYLMEMAELETVWMEVMESQNGNTNSTTQANSSGNSADKQYLGRPVLPSQSGSENAPTGASGQRP